MVLNLNPRVVSFHYTLKNQAGEQLESSFGSDPLMFLEGVGQIIPGLEEAIKKMNAGDKQTVTVKAAEAYGEVEKDMIVEVPRERLPKKDVEVGDRFHADAGDGHAQVVQVVKVTDTHVTIDGNHPLAGQDLTFEVEISATREATKEELAHGHAHGPGGHHH
ncbi:MAG: peptidylprolyl isomerase [Bdellovibrionales bacterium]|jgi:FKBP-type peptidyl-prolyl cis-trans isomerase SlyD|nr:peptidylprolyl isomerase [Bdellovibrionales bacterium]